MNMAELLRRSVGAGAKRPAVAYGNQVLQDYQSLAARASALAAGLRQRFALEPGDRVALAMKNCPEYLEVLYGLWWGGFAAVPMNAKLHPREFAYMLEHCGARLCFTTSDLSAAVGGVTAGLPEMLEVIEAGSSDYEALFSTGETTQPHPSGRDDLAWLFYTSGTTGRPKGAMLSHGNLLAMTACYLADVDAIAPQDTILHAAPMSHGSGLYLVPHVAAGACNLVPESGGFDAEEVLDLLQHHHGVTAFFAPTMIRRLVEHPATAAADLSNLKTIVYGGAPMYVADVERALGVLGNRLAQIYGQGESPMCITALPKHLYADRTHPRWRERIASAGQAQLLMEVAVVGEGDRPLPPGESGEVIVRGPAVMQGYWADAEATAATLAGGWLHTGDLGALDEDGFLTLMDRSKDVIISGGSNIYPREVEEVLLRHPGVAECSVIGAPDADWGEITVAFVVMRGGAEPDPQALDRLCLEEIARFKRPKHYRFIDALPKSNYGKILKTELRKLMESQTAS
ncbi:AMP-binding protein [Aquibaculum arenosum]|uniref:AMP-binding protein n=1 Tax=Aquibaculum arenosum TaxID=3032591 RepID=A0ABT5YMZ4_9PROT|nr:AMP-binding protein [Fodinicurvata sp. CAU 1616]MDF2096207.1 AMP-binding protein [Fodinicurvata sp. CAU 1616]